MNERAKFGFDSLTNTHVYTHTHTGEKQNSHQTLIIKTQNRFSKYKTPIFD